MEYALVFPKVAPINKGKYYIWLSETYFLPYNSPHNLLKRLTSVTSNSGYGECVHTWYVAFKVDDSYKKIVEREKLKIEKKSLELGELYQIECWHFSHMNSLYPCRLPWALKSAGGLPGQRSGLRNDCCLFPSHSLGSTRMTRKGATLKLSPSVRG